MAILEDVEVTIVSTSTGQPLTEVEDPDPKTEEHGKEVRKYIEAVTDEEFKIVIRLKKGFRYHGADGIDATLRIDGTAVNCHWYLARPENTHPFEPLEKIVSKTLSHTLTRKGTEWFNIAFSFGAASIDEDLHLDYEPLIANLARLGLIKVSLERVDARAGERDFARYSDLVTGQEEIDQKLLARSLTHTFKSGTATSGKAPSSICVVRTPIRGKHGKPVVYKFRYRSHAALQHLGCILSTPKPEPVPESSPLDMPQEDEDGQLLQLRAENAAKDTEIKQLKDAAQAQAQELEGARELKTKLAGLQSLLGNLASTATINPPAANVKAERIKRERDDETTKPTRPAKRRKPEYIDLG